MPAASLFRPQLQSVCPRSPVVSHMVAIMTKHVVHLRNCDAEGIGLQGQPQGATPLCKSSVIMQRHDGHHGRAPLHHAGYHDTPAPACTLLFTRKPSRNVRFRPAVQCRRIHASAAMTPNIVLHHAIPTRSCRVAWLLEELGVPYTLRPVEFPTGLWTDEYKEENPNQM